MHSQESNVAAACSHRSFRFQQRHVSDPCAAFVGGVLTECQAAVQFEIVDRYEVAVLIRDATSAFLELLAVLFCPPVAQIAFGIVLASLVVEAVCQLVANHDPDAAHVDGVIHLLVKKWRLENARREHDLIP